MKKPFLCWLGFHAFLEVGGGNTELFHQVFNPVKYKKYLCKHCHKIKVYHYEVPGQI